MSTASARVTISNKLGLHARPAMSLVDVASGFESQIKLSKGSMVVDAKSIMHLMMLAATRGTQLDVTAEGPDAEAAVEAIRQLVDSKFDED